MQGLGDYDKHSHKRIAEIFESDKKRIRYIEQKVLRKLRPSYNFPNNLKDFYERQNNEVNKNNFSKEIKMQLNLILEVKSQEMDKIFSESELLEFLKERLTIGKIDNIKILSAGVINAITVGECDFPNHLIKCLHENGIYYIYELQRFG